MTILQLLSSKYPQEAQKGFCQTSLISCWISEHTSEKNRTYSTCTKFFGYEYCNIIPITDLSFIHLTTISDLLLYVTLNETGIFEL
jgi:hypothetical protein